MENSIVLNQNQIVKLSKEFDELSKQAHFDNSWETHYQAALRAPAAFLLKEKAINFEVAFDNIIFHLDASFRNATDIEIKRAISSTADDLFSKIVFIIQTKIDVCKEQNDRKILDVVTNVIKKVTTKLFNPTTWIKGGAGVALAVAPEVADLLVGFLEHLSTKWLITKDENIFYNQLSRVYQKVLDSECYNPEFGLIRNTFIRNKEEIIKHVIYLKDLSSGKNLIKFDKNVSEVQESARIIIQALADKNDFDKAIEYLNELKASGFSNYKDLRDSLIQRYEQKQSFDNSTVFGNIKKKARKKVIKKNKYFILKVDGLLEEYLAKRKKIKIYSFVAALLIVVSISMLGYNYYNNEKGNYLNESKSEQVRVTKLYSDVNNLISNHKYFDAFNTTKEEMIWKYKAITSGSDETETLEKRDKIFRSIIDNGVIDLKSRNSQEMNEINYKFICQEILGVSSSIFSIWEKEKKESIMKEYQEKVKPVISELDNKRNSYLEKIDLKIKEKIYNGDKNTAVNLLAELYHNSNETMKSAFLGISKTTYKEYWSEKADEFKKKIN